MPAQFKIVTLSMADIKEVLALEKTVYTQPWTFDNFASELERKVTVAIGVKHEETLVAYCFFWLIAPETHLLNLAVTPAYQGHGLARKLICAMISLSRTAKVEKIFLEVRAQNKVATTLYESVGFKQTGRRLNYYDDGEDALLMTLKIIDGKSP
ncbi:MAG: ribosomal protein S18-alanine N-acetyltransferase [Candidatus Adiutrix sp.]